MQDRKRELEELINKYLQGRITDLECAKLMRWMRNLDLSNEHKVDIDQSYHKMKDQIDARLLLRADDKKAGRSWQHWGQVAAVLLSFLSLGWYLLEGRHVGEPVKGSGSFSSVETISVKHLKMTCTVSSDSLVLLEDGTRVHLLANSTMTWEQPFPAAHRAIQLQGKAFFQVAHDKKRPFTVLTGNIVTTALGTSFWVVQDNKTDKPKVRLVTGRVSIKERAENGVERLLTVLAPGQTWKETVALPKQQDRQAIEEEKIELPAVSNTLIFRHKPLAEVFRALAAFYSTTIHFSSEEVVGLSFYGKYTKDDDIAQILQTICIANDLDFTFDAPTNSYTVKKNNQ